MIVLGGIPTLFMIICLGINAYGRSSTVPWCFIRDGRTEAEWGLFYYYIGVCAIIGILLMGHIILSMFNSAARTGTRRRPGWWKQNVRPVLFILEFFMVFLFMMAYRAYIYFHQSEFEKSGQEMVRCLLSSSDPSLCPPHPIDRPRLGLFWLIQFCVSGQGLLNSVMYISQLNNFTLWWGLLTGKGNNYDVSTDTGSSHTPKKLHDRAQSNRSLPKSTDTPSSAMTGTTITIPSLPIHHGPSSSAAIVSPTVADRSIDSARQFDSARGSVTTNPPKNSGSIEMQTRGVNSI